MLFETSLLAETYRKAATTSNAINGFQARDVRPVDCSVFQIMIFGLVIKINCAEAITE
jgi:hypothetical protein